jgi:hypothetical protein
MLPDMVEHTPMAPGCRHVPPYAFLVWCKLVVVVHMISLWTWGAELLDGVCASSETSLFYDKFLSNKWRFTQMNFPHKLSNNVTFDILIIVGCVYIA